MRTLNGWKWLPIAAILATLVAGCATTPAPVVNHSFPLGQPTAGPGAQAPSGVQTFGLDHASGTTTAAGYTVAAGDTLYSIAFAHGMDFRTLAALNGIQSPYVIHPGQLLKLAPAQGAQPAAPTATVAAPVSAPAAPAPATSAAPVFGPVTSQSMTATGVAPAPAASAPAVAVAPATTASAPAAPATVVAPVAPPVPAAQQVQAAIPTPPPASTRNVAGIDWRWPAEGKVIGSFSPGAGGDGAGLNIAGNLGDPVRAAATGTVVYSGNGLIGYGELIIIKHNDSLLSAYGHNSKRLVKEGQRVEAGQEIALMGASGAPRVELHFEIRKNGKPVDPMGYLPHR